MPGIPGLFLFLAAMLTITMKSNIAEVTRRFRDLHQEQIPLAVAKALTFTAERVRDAEKREMQRVFDRPTPFTLNSLYLRGATPARLESRVWFKDLRFKKHYLLQQVKGLKYELQLAAGQDSLPVASFNLHETFFGQRFAMTLEDGTDAHSACVAFGLERWVLVFLEQQGPAAAEALIRRDSKR